MAEQHFEGLWFPEAHGSAVTVGPLLEEFQTFPSEGQFTSLGGLFQSRESLSRGDDLFSLLDADETGSLGFGHRGEDLQSLSPPIHQLNDFTSTPQIPSQSGSNLPMAGQRRSRPVDRLQQASDRESSRPPKRYCVRAGFGLEGRGCGGLGLDFIRRGDVSHPNPDGNFLNSEGSTGGLPVVPTPSLIPSLVSRDERPRNLVAKNAEERTSRAPAQLEVELLQQNSILCSSGRSLWSESADHMDIQATIVARPAKGSTPGRLEVTFHHPHPNNPSSQFPDLVPLPRLRPNDHSETSMREGIECFQSSLRSSNSPSSGASPSSSTTVSPVGNAPRHLPTFQKHQRQSAPVIRSQAVLRPSFMEVVPLSYQSRSPRRNQRHQLPQYQQHLQSDLCLPSPQNSHVLMYPLAQLKSHEPLFPSIPCGAHSHSHQPHFTVHWSSGMQCQYHSHHPTSYHHRHSQVTAHPNAPHPISSIVAAASLPPSAFTNSGSSGGYFSTPHPRLHHSFPDSSKQNHCYPTTAAAVPCPAFASFPLCSCYSSSPGSHHTHFSSFRN